MKCAKIQSCLLAAERPDQISSEVKRHLAECASCRAAHQRLVEIERAIPQLAVPPSTRRAAFVAQFVQFAQDTPTELPAVEPPPMVKLMRPTTPVKERGLRKLAFAFALAASLAGVAVGLWALNPGRPIKVDHTAVYRIRLTSRMNSKVTPRDRAETVLGVADEVLDDVRTLAQAKDVDSEKMADLAKYYRQLVGEELKKHARDLPPDANRKLVLKDLEERLQQTESEFTHLAATKGATRAAEPLQEIALAARETSADLHALATE
jgi:anti-sigma factor RsiW